MKLNKFFLTTLLFAAIGFLSLFQNCSAPGGQNTNTADKTVAISLENGEINEASTEADKESTSNPTPAAPSSPSQGTPGPATGGGLQANGDGYGVYLHISSVCRDHNRVSDKIIKEGDKFLQIKTHCFEHPPIDVTSRVDFKPENPEVLILDNKLFGLDTLKPASFFCRGISRAPEDGVTYDIDFSLTPVVKTLAPHKIGRGLLVRLNYEGYIIVKYKDPLFVSVTDRLLIRAFKVENSTSVNYVHSTYDLHVNGLERERLNSKQQYHPGFNIELMSGDVKFSDPMHLNFPSYRDSAVSSTTRQSNPRPHPVSLQDLTCFAKGLEIPERKK